MATRRKGAVSESPCLSAIFEARQDNIWSTLEQTSASEEPGRRQGKQRSCSHQARRTKKEEQQIAQTINTHKVLLPLAAGMLHLQENATRVLLDSVRKTMNQETSGQANARNRRKMTTKPTKGR